MKKTLLSGVFASIMLLSTSCQNDEPENLQGKENVVSFTLEQQGISTRAYSDGLSATNLTYAVYETIDGVETVVTTQSQVPTFTGKQATVTFTLEKGHTYDFLFWADAPESPYSFDAESKTITVGETLSCNDETHDAFYVAVKGVTIPESGSYSETITLTRPFAQLNIGAIGEAIGLEAAQSEVTITEVYTTLNLYDGTVGGQKAVTYAMNALPGETETFPVAEVNNYYSMNYLLVDAESELVTVDFTLTEENGETRSRSFYQIPVQRNHRTNIYGTIGNILSGSAEFYVTVDNEFEEPNSDANVSGICIGEKYYQTIEDALTDAVDGDIIYLGAGVYELPNYNVPNGNKYAQRKTLSFIGTSSPDCTIIKQRDSGAGEGNVDYSLDGSTITFENVSIEVSTESVRNNLAAGFPRCKATYKNCIIYGGEYYLYDKSSFEGCTFNVSGDRYNIRTWGVGEATFTKCTFNCDGKSVLVYPADVTLTFNSCTFNDNEGLVDEKKAAIETGDDYGNVTYNININNCEVNGFDINNKGIDTGTALWGNKSSMPTDRLNVFIDGVEVY